MEYLTRAEGAGSFFPGASVRPTPRRLLVLLAGLGWEAMIFEGGNHKPLQVVNEWKKDEHRRESCPWRKLGEIDGKEV